MALEVVGETFLSASLQVLFDRMDSLEIVDFIEERKINEGLFKKLKIMLLSASTVLNDAEEKQIRNPTVRKWLQELQGAVYDAEDLVQEINTEALRCKIEGQYGSRSSHQVRNLFTMTTTSFNEQVELKMKETLDKLEFILDQKVHLGLKEGVQSISSGRLPATSFVENYGVFGRDNEKEAIIKSLITDDGSSNQMSVTPIVGMGGIGKTTLAQLIYNDDRVKKCFDFKAWVPVSNKFDIFKITRTIAKGVTSQAFNRHDLGRLQDEVKEALKGKKFLVVLDDVWNENYFVWEEVKKPFACGAYGSKIIVTTRNENIASVIHGNISSYQLQPISDANCWKLFVKHAFNNADPSAYGKLEEIGRQIVKKCKGLPLEVKLLGSILRYQPSTEEWENILKSDMWELPKEKNSILPALWLSYYYLPSHLKRCFAYCSMFPKNYLISKNDLIKLWMAEDLLKPSKKKSMEEVGEEYCYDLLSRSLFQQSTIWNGLICYTMHDLVHDLASFVAGEFCLSLDDSGSNKFLSKLHHLSLEKEQIYELKKYKELSGVKCLRTFFFPPQCYGKICIQLQSLVATLTGLRSLSFSGCSMEKLPDSIGNLKLLRYLNISNTEIMEIPNTVCTLYNLQTLILSGCRELERLPPDIGSLINLRHLDITSTYLERMPLEMGNLKDLQTLTYFVAGKYSGYTIGLLRDLQHLHGKLRISGLENIVNVEDVLVANLKEKKYLTKLEFCWGSKYIFDINSGIMHREVLNGLEPHTSLKLLRIRCYQGEQFPKWVGDPSFCNLENIRLEGCRQCRVLPSLGQLPFLKLLFIGEFYELVKIGDEFYGGDCSVTTRPFRSLEYLRISDMKKWEEWSFIEGDGGDAVFPNLKQLFLEYCPKLTAHICLPNTIEGVYIYACKKFEFSGMQHPSYGNLRELQIVESCDFINSIELDYFPMLEELCLISCENLESLTYAQQSRPHAPLSLITVRLTDCQKLMSFPQGGLHAPNMKMFEIEDCSKLRSLPEHMHTLLPSLQTFCLENCPQLESFPECPMPSNLDDLEISKCNKLFASRWHWDLQKLVSLTIRSTDEVVLDSFPEEGLLPTTLIDLTIISFPHLKALNGMAFRHLSSLQQLEISGCNKLLCLPEEGLPASLTKLSINSCPLLKLQCLPEEGLLVWRGEDWPKIAHIPSIIINGVIANDEDIWEANLKGYQFISWRGDTDDMKNTQEEVFDRLKSPRKLEKLHIQAYGGKSFPNWGGYGSFSCSVKMDLVSCKICYCLPPLGQLPSLKKLHIQGFDKVERIGEEFYFAYSLSLSKPFKSLENLTFSHMLRWKEWSFMNGGVFSDLKQLTLDNCRKLKGTCFPNYLPSLQSLLISGCKQEVLASLSTDGLPLLSFLKIGHCKELESFPIRTLPANVDTIRIMGCKELFSLSEDGWPSKLKSLEICYCGKLFGNTMRWNLRTLTSLTSLKIIKIDEVVNSFPKEWQLPSTLKSLTLGHFRNVKSLNGKAFQHLTSLKELKIEFCHHLQYLPEERFPRSLSRLEIFGCGFLTRRCQKERGEDWPKIAHIPHIRIDFKDI